MKIAISSGKGGTGKTFIATNLAVLAAERGQAVTYLDCDVEAPNGHLFLKPDIERTERMTVSKPVRFDEERCMACGRCVAFCHYNALALIKGKVLIFPELCHACGACVVACPNGAVIEGDAEIGELYHGTSGPVAFHYGLLETGAGGMSPRLIHALKEYAGPALTILDSPPGTACASVETVSGADLCLLVTDPTPFSLHDLKLSVNMCRGIGQEPAVVLNRAGLDDRALRAYCESAQLDILGEIPDAREIAEVYSVGDVAIEKLPQYRPHFERLLDAALERAAHRRPANTGLIEPLFRPGGQAVRASKPDPRAQRPQEIAIVSGKGGTGKTSISACFAQLAEDSVVADCDVDAADLHLVLNPKVVEEGDFVGGITVEIDPEECTGCGNCFAVCRFHAVKRTPDGKCAIEPSLCEGCGACQIVCNDMAVSSEDAVNGKWYISETRFGPMAHAILGIAEENSGRLVTLVRDNATALSGESGRTGPVVMDGSPGTGCPVIASISGARYAVIVTEPTVSGLHDLGRILDLTRHFRVPSGVIVNKADLNAQMTERIRAATEERGAELLGRLPYEKRFTESQIERKTLLEQAECEAADLLRGIWDKVCQRVSSDRDDSKPTLSQPGTGR
ncbi:MAG: P-loop NTPase [Candidatus Hydrogenedentes bacterium]|nr:P-loop NTPase [Candidatus Hydrogenedentota bacterium]